MMNFAIIYVFLFIFIADTTNLVDSKHIEEKSQAFLIIHSLCGTEDRKIWIKKYNRFYDDKNYLYGTKITDKKYIRKYIYNDSRDPRFFIFISETCKGIVIAVLGQDIYKRSFRFDNDGDYLNNEKFKKDFIGKIIEWYFGNKIFKFFQINEFGWHLEKRAFDTDYLESVNIGDSLSRLKRKLRDSITDFKNLWGRSAGACDIIDAFISNDFQFLLDRFNIIEFVYRGCQKGDFGIIMKIIGITEPEEKIDFMSKFITYVNSEDFIFVVTQTILFFYDNLKQIVSLMLYSNKNTSENNAGLKEILCEIFSKEKKDFDFIDISKSLDENIAAIYNSFKFFNLSTKVKRSAYEILNIILEKITISQNIKSAFFKYIFIEIPNQIEHNRKDFLLTTNFINGFKSIFQEQNFTFHQQIPLIAALFVHSRNVMENYFKEE